LLLLLAGSPLVAVRVDGWVMSRSALHLLLLHLLLALRRGALLLLG
jgi:hypothetical protein